VPDQLVQTGSTSWEAGLAYLDRNPSANCDCTTHFYGNMNSPTTIEAVRELMATEGGSGSDIASMKVGEFYFTTEGAATPEKIKTSLCLSYHPQSPLAQEEVKKLARDTRPSRQSNLHGRGHNK
jgi:hypothetical protein